MKDKTRKKTKIVATISDRRCDVELIQKLYDSGMNVVRLNTAHQTFDDSLKVIQNVRKVSDTIAIMIDTKGPEVRTGKELEALDVKNGDEILVGGQIEKPANAELPYIFVNYVDFVKDVPVDSEILIDDGHLLLKVNSKTDEYLVCQVQNDGVVKPRKSVNVPGVSLALPSVTQRDEDYIRFAAKNDVDFIAHSFVRSKKDVQAVQKILDEEKSSIKIISKIENREGVENISEILDDTYGVMVARGDLGVEIPGEEVPLAQKHLVQECILRARPVIVATQMLESMINNPRPTRAEISDVATAVLDGADAIMLSGETAYGDYPVEAVQVMNRIALKMEGELAQDRPQGCALGSSQLEYASYIIQAAVRAAEDLQTEAIVMPTRAGKSALYAASYRPSRPIYAACFQGNAHRELALCYGVFPFWINMNSRSELRYQAKEYLVENNWLDENDVVVTLISTRGDGNVPRNQMHINTPANSLSNYRKRQEALAEIQSY
jgi:pyruvate kinase